MPFQMLLNMPLGMTSIALGLGGHNFVLYPGAAAAASCLEGAVRAIEQGRLTRILVGGTAQGVSLLPLGTAIRLERLAASPSAAQPFSPRHRGWAAADGAACVLLESAATARERGCQPLAEVGRPALRRSAAGAPLSAGARQRLWAEVCGERPPDLVMASGRVDSEGDGAALAAVEAIWPAQPVRLTSADGALGHPGPAAAVQSLALSALMIARHRTLGVPSLTGIPVSPRVLAGAEAPAPQRILLSIEDPDGAEAAVALAEADR
jgi:malonyl-ACP decarboxylase